MIIWSAMTFEWVHGLATFCEWIIPTISMSCINNFHCFFVVSIGTLLLFVHSSKVSHDMSRKHSQTQTSNPTPSYTKQSLQTVREGPLTSTGVNDVNSRHQQSEKQDRQRQEHLFNILNRPFASHDSYHYKQPAGHLLTVSLRQSLQPINFS